MGIRMVSLQLVAHRKEARIPFPQWEMPSSLLWLKSIRKEGNASTRKCEEEETLRPL